MYTFRSQKWSSTTKICSRPSQRKRRRLLDGKNDQFYLLLNHAMAVLYLLLKIAMNGYNLILFSMGCCSSGDQEYFRSMENEVQGMLKNSELLKNPKVASQLAKDVMEYMYCKIKKDYVVYLRK